MVTMMVSPGMILCASLVIQFMVLGVVAEGEWAVNYISKSVCALKGSEVTMSCTYTYPSDHSVQKAFWMNKLVTGGEGPNLSNDPEYRGRVQYLGDKQHNCTVLLRNLTEKDQSKYYFRFITDQPGGSWQGTGGVDLSVTDLQVEVPERVIEGDEVTLTCKTTCSLTVRRAFTWYRDGHPLSSSTDQLHLQPVSREDAGRYRCAVLGQNLQSPEVTLNVRSVADDKWAVNYNSKSICALKGSAVTMSCTYTYPSGLTVQRAFWMNKLVASGEAPNLSDDPEYRGRVQYLGDKQHNCTLRLSDVRETDKRKYYFRFLTDRHGGSWQGEDGVDLSVTDLQVEVPERVMEGDKVTLTCKTTCSLTVTPTFTWYRNEHPLSSSTDQLHLQPVSREDAGRYHCAVLGQDLRSPEVTLNVRFSPKSISVSIHPSGEIVEGGSVTLTCSSDANPPVEYHWFKGTSLAAKRETYTMKKISSVDSGEYKCRSSNEHGYKYSEALNLNVLYPPKNTLVSISPSGKIVEGSSVTLTCSSDANPPVESYMWFKDAGASTIGSGYSYSFTFDSKSSGLYYCLAQSKHGSQKSAGIPVNVKGDYIMILYVAFGLSLCAVAALLVIVCLMSRKKRKTRKADKHDYQNFDPNAKDDTYTALDRMSRSPDYDTLATVRNQKRMFLFVDVSCSAGGRPGSPKRGRKNASDKLLISLRMSLTVSLVFLLFISGVVAQYVWGVDYNSKSICAVKGSTVTMYCTYTYPRRYWVRKAFWTKEWGQGSEPRDLSEDPEYRGRVKYIGDKQHNCTLRLSDVTENDQRRYYFRFLTHEPGGRYQGADGVYLSVTDLQVEVPERVKEGDKVTLTCKTSCSLSDRPTFTWYRNGRYLSSSTDQLHLQPVSRENKDRYRCAVLGQKLHSPEVTLNVRYGPKSISVSISPTGEIVEGSSVNLTCSSDGNPPVEYNWFKGTSSVGKGETFTMKKISSVDSGEYKCRSSNEHGNKYSEALTLNVLYPPKSISVSISPSGEIVEGSSVNLTCSSDANPPVQKYTWFKKLDHGVLQKSTSQIYSISNISSADSGEYRCMANNTQGFRYSEYKSLTVLYAPKKALASISESAEGSSVNLTCSSDANPPVQNYTWFKEGGSSPVGYGHRYTALQSGSYYCEAHNEHGSQKSAAVTVTVKGVSIAVLFAFLGMAAGCGCLFAIIAVLYVRRKRKCDSAKHADQKEENIYSNVAAGAATNDTAPDPDLSNQDDAYYAVPTARNPDSAFGTDEEVQYASIQFHCKKVAEKTEGDSTEYTNIRFTHTSATNRSATSMTEDPSVIYSTMK
ncbi:uncharacterized protein LOC108413703 [Pygocentrus nattereri]|uniref:uncharacterized protein LOC108413703 n=1 Tax=Pygocentrus nattereri TaxID=42514 RepID=UPI001890BAB6|nr:uncharacterized protein LOC108413703 [Pygocentrus nattereri]